MVCFAFMIILNFQRIVNTSFIRMKHTLCVLCLKQTLINYHAYNVFIIYFTAFVIIHHMWHRWNYLWQRVRAEKNSMPTPKVHCSSYKGTLWLVVWNTLLFKIVFQS